MASSETPPPSLRQGVRIVPPDNSVTVEEVLLSVGEQVGHDKLSFASRMNKAVVVFLKQEALVHRLIESGVFIRDTFVQVSPLSAPSTRITVSGVPPFIPNELLEKELRRFGKFASGLKTVSLGCKDPKLRHVQSLRRQLFMFLDSPTQTLEVSFRVKHGDGSYVVYASSGQLRCFQCGDVGHKRFNCPQRKKAGSAGTDAGEGATPADDGPVAEPTVDEPVVEPMSDRPVDKPTADGPVVEQTADEPVVEQTVEPVADGPGAGPAAAVADGGTAGAAAGDKNKDEREQSQTGEQQADVPENSSSQTGQPQPEDTVEEAASTSVELSVSNSQLSCGEDMEEDSVSDMESVSGTPRKDTDLYSLEKIEMFLDKTFNKNCVKVSNHFRDIPKFIKSVNFHMKGVGVDILEEKKRFRLKKHLTALKKTQLQRVLRSVKKTIR